MTAPRRHASAWLAALLVAALAWSALLLLAPAWVQTGSSHGALTPRATVAGMTYLLASRVCHQRPDRSFHLHGQPQPVCGRCAGLYLSGAVGLLAGVGARRRTTSARLAHSLLTPGVQRRALWLAVAALPTALTWSAEMVGLWNPGTNLRALASIPLGMVAGAFIAARRQ